MSVQSLGWDKFWVDGFVCLDAMNRAIALKLSAEKVIRFLIGEWFGIVVEILAQPDFSMIRWPH